MPSEGLQIKDLNPSITTFTAPFNRFAPLGRSLPTFIAVGNRATAIRLVNSQILLLNPIQLEPRIQNKLDQLGGVHYLACDLGHHMYVASYLHIWPTAKTIGVPGLEGKRKDVKWDYIIDSSSRKKNNNNSDNDDVMGNKSDMYPSCLESDLEFVSFEGFITNCIAWYHRPTKTLIQSDLLMNLPCTEQYDPSSSATQGPGSWLFAQLANPRSDGFRRLIWYIATVDYSLVRRDAKAVAEWEIQRIIPCHGDVIEGGGNEMWQEAYKWFLKGGSRPDVFRSLVDRVGFMRLVRRVFLM